MDKKKRGGGGWGDVRIEFFLLLYRHTSLYSIAEYAHNNTVCSYYSVFLPSQTWWKSRTHLNKGHYVTISLIPCWESASITLGVHQKPGKISYHISMLSHRTSWHLAFTLHQVFYFVHSSAHLHSCSLSLTLMRYAAARVALRERPALQWI